MGSRRTDQQLAFVLSILGHGAIVAALTFSIPLGRNRLPAGEIVVPIETVMINEAAIEAEIARIEAAEEANRQRLLEEERQRQLEEQERQERVQQEQAELERVQREREEAERVALEEQAQREAEAVAERRRLQILEEERVERERQEAERVAAERAAEEQRQRQEAERVAAERAAEEARLRREAEERARRDAVEADLARAIAAEQEARAARDAGLRDQWARAISDRVALYWIRPPNVSSELECVLVVEQLPNGEVIDVDIDQCNTNDGNIIRSIENAVLNASPLPQPPRGVAFERVVRITFSPDD